MLTTGGDSATLSPEILPGLAPNWDTPFPLTNYILMTSILTR